MLIPSPKMKNPRKLWYRPRQCRLDLMQLSCRMFAHGRCPPQEYPKASTHGSQANRITREALQLPLGPQVVARIIG
jgi:hypothetical protein